jgi:hypothetical protein
MELTESIKKQNSLIHPTAPPQKCETYDFNPNSQSEKNVQNFYTPPMEAKLRTKPYSTIKKVRCLQTNRTPGAEKTNPESEGENGR